MAKIQHSQVVWVREIRSLMTGVAAQMCRDAEGNILVSGIGPGMDSGQEQAFVAKFNRFGEELWRQAAGLPGRGLVSARIAVGDMGSLLLGDDYGIRKLGPDGTFLPYEWRLTEGGRVEGLLGDGEGGCVALIHSGEEGRNEWELVRLDASGKLTGTERLQGDASVNWGGKAVLGLLGISRDEIFISVLPLPGTGGKIHIWKGKFGNLSCKSLELNGIEVEGILPLPESKDFLIYGSPLSQDGSEPGCKLMRISLEGDLKWIQIVGVENSLKIRTAIIDADGDWIIAGSCTPAAGGAQDQEGDSRDIWIGKFSLLGERLWAYEWGVVPGTHDEVVQIASDSNGRLLLLGKYCLSEPETSPETEYRSFLAGISPGKFDPARLEAAFGSYQSYFRQIRTQLGKTDGPLSQEMEVAIGRAEQEIADEIRLLLASVKGGKG